MNKWRKWSPFRVLKRSRTAPAPTPFPQHLANPISSIIKPTPPYLWYSPDSEDGKKIIRENEKALVEGVNRLFAHLHFEPSVALLWGDDFGFNHASCHNTPLILQGIVDDRSLISILGVILFDDNIKQIDLTIGDRIEPTWHCDDIIAFLNSSTSKSLYPRVAITGGIMALPDFGIKAKVTPKEGVDSVSLHFFGLKATSRHRITVTKPINISEKPDEGPAPASTMPKATSTISEEALKQLEKELGLNS